MSHNLEEQDAGVAHVATALSAQCRSSTQARLSRPLQHMHAVAVALAFVAPLVAYAAASACADYGAPTAPQVIGSVDTPGTALGVAVSGDLAFVADHGRGLQVIDIGDLTSPRIVGAVFTASSAARGVEVLGDYVLVADEVFGLLICDATDPASPVLLSSVDTPGSAFAVTASRGFAFVADYLEGVIVVDIRNPRVPQIVGAVAVPGNTYDLEVSGDLLLVAFSGGLRVADISDPIGPVTIGEIATIGSAYSVSCVGTTAYVAAGSFGLGVIDISNPAHPQLVGNVSSPQHAHAVAVSNNFVYVADELPGLWVVDISDPAQPQYVGVVAVPSAARSVALFGDDAFVATEATGFQVLPRQCGDIARFSLAIADVTSDQGGSLQVSWPRHPEDAPASRLPVTSYQLQRLEQEWQTIADLAAANADWTSPGFVDTSQLVAEAPSNASGLTPPTWL